MNQRTLITTVIFVTSLIACTKTDKTDDHDPIQRSNLTQLHVNVIERTPGGAIIQWNASKNELNNEVVRYKVILGNVKLKDSLTILTDTLLNLEKNQIYSGKVVAFISGDSTSAEFNLSTYDGQLFAFTRGIAHPNAARFGCFNSYPIVLGNRQPSIWRFDTDDMLTPTLSNDTLFIVAKYKLKAINATTGNLIWQCGSNLEFVTSVTYSGGRLFACSKTGTLACVNGRTGEVLWNYVPANYVVLNSNPVTEGNLVFASQINSPIGEIHAVDAVTGQKVWNYILNGNTCRRPLATKGLVVINMSGRALALNAGTGTLVWNKALVSSSVYKVNPVYIDGNVVLSGDGVVYALDLKTGGQKWQYQNRGDIAECVAGNGMVYLCKDTAVVPVPGAGPSSATMIKAISAKDGNEIWTQSVYTNVHYSSLVFAKDKVYAIYNTGIFLARIFTFNASIGQLDSKFIDNNPVNLYNSPTLVPEDVIDFIVRRDGVVCYPSTHGNYQ